MHNCIYCSLDCDCGEENTAFCEGCGFCGDEGYNDLTSIYDDGWLIEDDYDGDEDY